MLNGNLIHFVVADGPEDMHGQCRPALVVQDWTVQGEYHLLNLVVFRDGYNDRRLMVTESNGQREYEDGCTEWRTSINHAHPKEFGTWHTVAECGGLLRNDPV